MNTKNNKNTEENREILRIEQIELMDSKLFGALENVLGIRFLNYRLVTLQQQVSQNEDNSGSGGSEQQSSEGNQSKEKKDNKSVEITEVVDDNTVFEKNTQPDWEKAQQYIRQVSDIAIDIQIELKKQGIPEEEIKEYGEHISSLVLNISNKDKQKATKDLEKIYTSMYDVLNKLIKNEKKLSIKKLYYDLVQLLLQLEQKKEYQFNEILETIKEDMKNIDKNVINENKKYIEERVKMLVENMDYKKMNDAKLKIVMLVNTIPVLEFTTTER